MIRFATLCTGIEGFGIGFERAGMECVFQCEQNRDCLKILERHFPETERTTDVNDGATSEAVRRLRPDVIAFGSPCQDLSVAGKRGGLAGERSGLFFRCVELCFECEAPLVVWENVPGVFSSPTKRPGEDFASVLEAFTGFRPAVPPEGWKDTGVCVGPLYSVAWAVLDAQWFGVAQRRRRVFLVASLGSRSRPYEILSLAESVPWNPAPRRETGAGVAASLSAGSASGSGVNQSGRRREDDFNLTVGTITPGAHPGGYNGQDAYTGHIVTATLNSGGNACGFRTEPGEHLVTHPLTAEGHDASEDGTGRGTPLIFDPRQVTSPDNRSNPQPGDPCHTLHEIPPAVAFQADDYHEGTFEISDQSRPLTTSADRSRAAPIVIDDREVEEIDSALKSRGMTMDSVIAAFEGMGRPAPEKCYAFQTRIARNGRRQPKDITDALTSCEGGTHADTKPHVATGSVIRRLTPRECERLQGFPDDWTRFDAQGKEISDSARYRACGNAVCVNVAEWIGHRIVEAHRRALEQLKQEQGNG